MSRAVIAIGSNLGDREATVVDAVRAIASLDGVELVAASGVYETVAIKLHGVDVDAPAYLNAVVIVETAIEPRPLLEALHAIEHDHGRVRDERWGDRTLDLDLIDVDGVVIDDAGLTLPHPRAHERLFVLDPWLEADPAATLNAHPVVELVERLRRVEPVETSPTENSK